MCVTKNLKLVYAATIICGIASVMNSCSTYEDPVEVLDSAVKFDKHRITADQAKKNALNFIEQFRTKARGSQEAKWGGKGNGYFLSDVFNSEESYYDDNANQTTRGYYKYNLKISTICK